MSDASRPHPVQVALHDMGRPHRMRESGVLGAGERERRMPQGSDTAQALDLPGVHEPSDDALHLPLERDQAVNGVAEDHGSCHTCPPRR